MTAEMSARAQVAEAIRHTLAIHPWGRDLPYPFSEYVERLKLEIADAAIAAYRAASGALGFLVQCDVCPQRAVVATQPPEGGWVCPRCADVTGSTAADDGPLMGTREAIDRAAELGMLSGAVRVGDPCFLCGTPMVPASRTWPAALVPDGYRIHGSHGLCRSCYQRRHTDPEITELVAQAKESHGVAS